MKTSGRIVAVGLLTERDLRVLGTGFQRAFPVNSDTMFDDLLRAIDAAEAAGAAGPTPSGSGLRG